MNETNFDWDDLRLFLAVARQGGLAAAEAETGKSAPTLARRLLSLERKLGQQLFDRQPRGYELTADGVKLQERVENIEKDIQPIAASGSSFTKRRVKISAGTWTTHLLLEKLLPLMDDPSITLQFISADRVLDIPHREAVIGIRNHRPNQVSLAGRQLNTVQFAAYSSNKNTDNWVFVQNDTPSAVWVRDNYSGSPCIEVTNPRNALDIALTGVANTVLPTFIGDAVAGIEKMSDNIEELEHMQWLVSHHEDRNLPEVRYVLDLFQQIFEG